MRARYCEDHVERVVRSGVDQFVIIGAGFDSFALRRTDLMKDLTVYEIDSPASQSAKIRRLQAAGLEVPGGLVFVSADLNVVNLHDAIAEAGFDHGRPAVFSWFGVTYYLPRETVERTLADISERCAAGSVVLFDYIAEPSWTDPKFRELQERCAAYVARKGEPWICMFEPDEITGLLERSGFTDYRASIKVRIQRQSR